MNEWMNDTRSYFNVRSKPDISQLNGPPWVCDDFPNFSSECLPRLCRFFVVFFSQPVTAPSDAQPISQQLLITRSRDPATSRPQALPLYLRSATPTSTSWRTWRHAPRHCVAMTSPRGHVTRTPTNGACARCSRQTTVHDCRKITVSRYHDIHREYGDFARVCGHLAPRSWLVFMF